MSAEEPGTDQPLLVDELSERLDRFRILYGRDDAATDDLLAELGWLLIPLGLFLAFALF